MLLADVARHAGVSTASVSRVLNAPERVSDDVRRRVERAVAELGYIPSGAARALASRETRAMGALVPTLNNAIFASGINSLQRRLGQLGYALLVASCEYDLDEELQQARTLLAHGVEGLMVVGSAHAPELDRLVGQRGVPLVRCWTYDPDDEVACIGFDNRAAARGVAEYLLDLGHRRIGMIAGIRRGNDRAQARVDGVRQALAARGLELPAKRLVESRYDVAEGRQALRYLMAAPERPTAVICGNDVLAQGALFECQAEGLAVPGSLSITGFDDLKISAQLVPPLTTVRVPSAEMGERAADYLVESRRGAPLVNHVEVETSLVVRGTTAPPPA
ncbi:LacI family DNA-binding transcriptional regulator [Sediminicurvatus halobius]|uniref:LacI family transcriptional regulator n=1 Tax=Sediminicurvatus halobius TaxID=2182432 RepID=A0A2U2N635_9GAMM|nr:LacI family DNA-binding transcriptional regulator [Spiribacter halobius]PWG64528.1 LacI family transcriptional regulator [Spiribacter halobius]UEX79149.1 LacI family DNA-binding transcriptional regulator [Spiribacter halobius]